MRAWLMAFLMSAVVLSGCVSDGPSEDIDSTPTVPDGSTIGGLVQDPAAAPEKVLPYLPGDYVFNESYAQVLEDGPFDILPQGRFTIASEQDGADIEMALWLPDVPADQVVGTLLFSSPYFWGADNVNECAEIPFLGTACTGSARTVDNPGGSVQVLIDNIVPHGFAFATHAIRGTAGSGGCNDLMGPTETADIDQAVTYLGTQEWSNGAIGMTGVSYDGSTPWAAATTGNPHLKTIIPISGVPDMHGLMYRNGSSETRGPALLNALYVAGGIGSRGMGEGWAEGALCPEAYEGLATSVVTGIHGSDLTGYWQERNRKADVAANYQGSVFSIQGLQDWNVDPSQVIPWVDELDQQGLKTKQLLGQWAHNWPDGNVDRNRDGEVTDEEAYEMWSFRFRADYKQTLLMWLRSELNGEDVWTGPPVQVMDSDLRWRNEAHFPPRDATWTTYHLNPNGLMETVQDGQESIILTPNPRTVINPTFLLPEQREELPVDPDSYVDFILPSRDHDTLITGLPKVHVTVTPHGPGGYMAAYLYEKDAETDDLKRLGWTTMNLGYAAGGTEYTPVVPGQPLKVNMEIQPMDAVVHADNRLVLRLWVFTDGDRLPTIPPNGASLELGHELETVIVLPTVERAASDYFMPPAPPEPVDEEESEA